MPPLVRNASGFVVRNWRDAVVPGAAVTGIIGETARRNRSHSMTPAAAAAAGGGLAEGAYRAAGLGVVRHKGKQLERVRPEGMSRSQYQKITERHRKAHGVHSGQRAGVPKEFYRNYPKELPAWKWKRFQGWTMSGKRGLAGEAALVGGSALAASRAASNHRRPRHANVGKRLLVDDSSRISPTRVVETGVGVGAVAYGAPRMRMVENAFARGKPGKPINTAVERALREAEAVRTVMVHSTDPLGRVTGRGIGHMPNQLRNSLERVPRHLRPATATLVGAILTAHAHPVRRTSYQVIGG